MHFDHLFYKLLMEKTSILCINVIYALHVLLSPFVEENTSKDQK